MEETRTGPRLRRHVGTLLSRLRHGRFHTLKQRAQGMLAPGVYRAIYEFVRPLPDRDIVEIGAAGGAASIALALAVKESGKRSHVVVVEKFEGGSRSELGDRATNLERFERACAAFGVRDRIRLFAEHLTLENGHRVLELVDTDVIACLVHDADGALDRDFQLFWPRLIEDGGIIIDDYDNHHGFKPISTRHPFGGTKKLKTYRLANQLIEWGLMEPVERLDGTLFAVKPTGADMTRFDPDALQRIVDEVMAEQREWERRRVS